MSRLFTVAIIMSACVIGSCADSTKSVKESPPPDDTFAEGAQRPPTVKTRFTLARLLAGQGKDAECIFVLRQIIQENPAFLPAYNELAELYVRRGRHNDAVAVVQSGLRAAQNKDPVLFNNLGMCLMLTHDYEGALEAFTLASNLALSEPKYQANRAVALGMLGRDDDALQQFEQVLTPDDARHNVEVIRQARACLAEVK